MTIAAIKAIAAKHGNDAMIVFGFDNQEAYYYVGDVLYSNDVLVTMADTEYVKTKCFILNKETGKCDIPVTVYKGIENIQSVFVLDNPSDRPNIDTRDLKLR